MEEFSKLMKKIKWDSIIVALCSIILGILCVALPSKAGDTLCITFGVLQIVMSVSLYIRYFKYERMFGGEFLILAIVMLISGVFFIVANRAVQSVLTVLFGLYILVDSGYSILDATNCIRAHIKGGYFLLVVGILTAFLGVSVMFSTFDSVMIFAGISLIFDGVKRLIFTICYGVKVKQAKKVLQEQMRDHSRDIYM